MTKRECLLEDLFEACRSMERNNGVSRELFNKAYYDMACVCDEILEIDQGINLEDDDYES